MAGPWASFGVRSSKPVGLSDLSCRQDRGEWFRALQVCSFPLLGSTTTCTRRNAVAMHDRCQNVRQLCVVQVSAAAGGLLEHDRPRERPRVSEVPFWIATSSASFAGPALPPNYHEADLVWHGAVAELVFDWTSRSRVCSEAHDPSNLIPTQEHFEWT